MKSKDIPLFSLTVSYNCDKPQCDLSIKQGPRTLHKWSYSVIFISPAEERGSRAVELMCAHKDISLTQTQQS